MCEKNGCYNDDVRSDKYPCGSIIATYLTFIKDYTCSNIRAKVRCLVLIEPRVIMTRHYDTHFYIYYTHTHRQTYTHTCVYTLEKN